ncbi:MAG TPA: TIM barrel protein [Amaricoccus sp.]|uniref:sugar phosphate isomerase/epimerase family protein n=1 Tax=Amaricoccus sp. TaxID=1872485 RepID=UPI002C44ECC4|nr:TIM barrel protein [Amaricoccus sp.]HMQ95008.1 TIM barrel protein [Amaricoccus sp.]HMR37813.1 TIM barrel protein [Paracoccus sp. (in: a-proteobacteria)]HMR54811.1 TIM barrel protein [Amaricoccus sp.]HMU01853.1 TIM barrel protein [Amaricoccus sp.]
MTRPIGLGHFTFLELAPADLVRLARQAGFGFVGLRFHPVAPGQLHYLPDARGLAELGRVMAGEGIALYDIETVVIDRHLDPSTLIPALEAATKLGAKRVNTCADLFEGLPDRFAQICDLAGDHGLGVDIECMAWRGIDSPQACLDLIARSGASNAAYLVDALHHTRCGGTPESITAMSSSSICSAQLCDAPAAVPTGTDVLIAEARGGRLLPGEGSLPLREIVAALPAETVVSVELPSVSDRRPPSDRARAIYTATTALLEGRSR